MVVLVGAFLALGWWQISRATAGNTTSWAYAFEWPIFAGFVLFVWWREVRQELRSPAEGRHPVPPGADPAGRPDPGQATVSAGPDAATGEAGASVGPGPTPGVRRPVRVSRGAARAAEGPEDGDLAAYNHYLSWLNANPGARPGDYPG
jgi:hypothetical protein